MMQAWKYSLPAFLVPFMFAASPVGANLLIVGGNRTGFILALLNSSASLFFLVAGNRRLPGRPSFLDRNAPF